MGNIRKGLRMREAGIVIASVMEISLCAMFYDSFMTRFERVHKWHGYLWMAVVGVAQWYVLRFAAEGLLQFIIYMAFHAILGIIFIDAFRVVWLYLVVFTGFRLFLKICIGTFAGRFQQQGFPKMLEEILIISLQALFVYGVHFFQKNYERQKSNLFLKMFLFPTISLGFVLSFFYWSMKRGGTDHGLCYFMLCFAVALNVLYYIVLEKVEISCVTEMRRKEYEQKNEDYQEQYYKQLERQQTEIRTMRHDMKNQLIGILGEMEDGDFVRAKSEMIRILKGIEETEMIFYTANPGMNAVLNYKSAEMERKYIRFSCKVDLPTDLRMEARDIGILVRNLLDNAIEGCERCYGSRYIELKAAYQNHTVVIVCENSTDGMVTGLETRKDDRMAHGMGIQSMKRLVKSYGGEMDLQIYENSFCVTVTIFKV